MLRAGAAENRSAADEVFLVGFAAVLAIGHPLHVSGIGEEFAVNSRIKHRLCHGHGRIVITMTAAVEEPGSVWRGGARQVKARGPRAEGPLLDVRNPGSLRHAD